MWLGDCLLAYAGGMISMREANKFGGFKAMIKNSKQIILISHFFGRASMPLLLHGLPS